MSNPDKDTYYETLGLPPDATLDQVKSRFKEVNQAYLKILELSRSANTGSVQPKPEPKQKSSPQRHIQNQ